MNRKIAHGTSALGVLALLMMVGSPAQSAILPLVGVATATGAIFTFPVTGGTLDSISGAALVEHNGSGVALTAGAISAFIGNFLIDTSAATVFGDGAVLGGAGD